MSTLTARGAGPLILAFIVALALPPSARAQFGLGGLLDGNVLDPNAKQAGPRAAPSRALDPISLGAPPIDEAAPSSARYDVALVLLEPRGNRGALALADAEGYWTRQHARVAPRALVERRVRELGLYTPDALAAGDYAMLGRMIGARHLILLSVASDGTRRQILSGGPGRVLLAGALFAARGVTRHVTPGEAAGIATGFVAAALIAGITAVATCDLSCQVFDCAAGRTVWVRTASVTKRKWLLGLFADKAALASRARSEAVERLFAEVSGKLPRVHSR